MTAAARTGCYTESGRRPVNQDAVLAVRLADGRELVAIADGMGGHNAGEVASRRALETVWLRLREGADLRSAVAAANAAIHDAAASNAAWTGMGTTLVVMLRAGGSYQIANVGDSRAYRIVGGTADQVTTDHTFATEARLDPRADSDKPLPAPWRNALTRALGTDAHVDVDVFGPYDVAEPHALVLCSDGVHRSLSDDALVRHVGQVEDPWAAARSLAVEAYRNGSTDNISAAVILFGSTRPRPASVPRSGARRRRRPGRAARRLELK